MTTVDNPSGPSADWLAEARPRLHPEVRIGPLLTRGEGDVHIVGDVRTGAFAKVGPREAFLMHRLDGRHSLADIGTAYAEEFGRRLAPAHWQQLLGMLTSRGMIEPADEARLAEVRDRAAEARRAAGRSPLLWRQPVRGVAGLVPAVTRAFGWLLHPVAVVPLALAGLAVVVYSLLSWASLFDAFTGAPNRWSVSIVAFVVTWLIIAAHEFGHGVACRRYGGNPTEIGVMWRFPLIAPYCKVDDVVTFRRRTHRVMTSFAGVYINLIALLPALALWWWGPADAWWRGLAAGLLIMGAAATLGNLVPVFKLDGYHMLEHATATMNLQSESFRFGASVFRRRWAALRGRPAEPSGYSTRARRIYTGYLLLTAAILGPALVLLIRFWHQTLAGYWGAGWAVAFLVVEAIVVAAFLRWAIAWRQKKIKEA